MRRSPNILFFQVDQLSARALSAYGNPFSKTPVLDRIAASGAVFETAYCNYPLCSPSRASMASGLLASNCGAYDNAAEFSAEIPTYAHHLRARGYQTALSGKMHFIGPDQFHGFEQRLTADLYPADFAWAPNWANEGERDTNDPRAVTVSGQCADSVQIGFDEEVADAAIRYLRGLAPGDGRPFFLQVSFTHPHEPYLCKPEFWELYEGVEIPPPAVGPLSREEHDAHSVRILDDFGMLDYDFDAVDIVRARRAYYGAVSYIDSLIGRVVAALEEVGAADDTIIAFTSDHGEMLGERGIWFKKHFFEDSIAVPLFIAGPGIAPGRVTTPASLVDLLPTFNGLADGAVWKDEELDGQDLTQFFAAETPDRAIYAEYLAEAALAPIFMIRRGRFKCMLSEADPPLLFNVEADPSEMMNLAADTSYAEVLARFEAEAAEKWDSRRLTQDILLSQRRRGLIREAMAQGAPVRWNHGEAPGEATRWYRGIGGYNEWAFAHDPA